MTEMVTCICMETHNGYPDPLIYVVPIGTEEEICDSVLEMRVDEIGEEWRQYLEASFKVCFAIKGDLEWRDLIFDRRM